MATGLSGANRSARPGDELLNLRVSSVEQLAAECARFHDFPFDIEAQSFDSARRVWTGTFVHGTGDPARVTRRGPWLFRVTEFPVFACAITIHNVLEAEVQDRSQIGVFSFRQVHQTASGCRFEFHQDCDIYIHVDGPFVAELRDVEELTGVRGRIISVGFVDFGVGLATPPG